MLQTPHPLPYNAVNRSHYKDPGAIEIATLKDIMYLGMRNDLSFLIANEINLYEQQSTYNPNMPLRLLQYAANAYEKYISQRNLNKSDLYLSGLRRQIF